MSMKYFLIVLVALFMLDCSSKLAPDAYWGRNRWVVVEMKGVPVQLSGGRNDAYITFNVTDKKFNGNGGCNQINGNYSVDKKDLKFSEIITTRMSCPDIAFENALLELFGKVDGYEVKNDDLVLKDDKDKVLVLRARY